MDRQDRKSEGFDADATMAVPATTDRVPTYPYRSGEAILPGYRLDKRLGSGGFGEVWRATAPGGMGVAIKILANLGRAQGGREYRALQTIKNIRHAHIVPIFGVWLKAGDGRVLGESELHEAERRLLSARGREWGAEQAAAATVESDETAGSLESLELVIAMGLGDQTLSDRLRERLKQGKQGIPFDQLVDWMHQAALALDHFNSGARTSGENLTAVQHCDIKPQNILLVGDAVQVCDFGLARAQGEVRATSNTMASLAYAAPEMVSGRYDPSPSTDQYSLAMTYVELRTGRLPYAEISPVAIMKAKLDGDVDLSSLPAAEAGAVRRALALDPSLRWRTCAEFVRAVKAAGRASEAIDSLAIRDSLVVDGPSVAGSTLPARAADEPTKTIEPRGSGSPDAPGVASRRRRWRIAGVLVTLIPLAALAGYVLVGRGPPPTTREAAAALERASRFAEAGDAYAGLLAGRADELARILWDLQTQAADARLFGECVPLLRRLERLYAASPAPKVDRISRWDVVNSLAWYLATNPSPGGGDVAEAERLADEGLSLAGRDPVMLPQALDTAAATAARAGRFDEAVRRIDEAVTAAADPQMRAEFERRRQAYRDKRPWTERPSR